MRLANTLTSLRPGGLKGEVHASTKPAIIETKVRACEKRLHLTKETDSACTVFDSQRPAKCVRLTQRQKEDSWSYASISAKAVTERNPVEQVSPQARGRYDSLHRYPKLKVFN